MAMDESNLKTKGIVFDLQRFSLHDGPGIRTIVFLKGCPLACRWCSNPESQQRDPQLMFISNNCIGCKRCISVCSVGALDFSNPFPINYDKCRACGKCVRVCYSGALNMAGAAKTVEDVLAELKKDTVHYRRSGGGITLSGGESLVQAEFAEQLLKGCKANGWHTAIETTAFANEEALKRVLPWLDLVLLDIKHMDHNKHKEYTGQSNEIILRNARIIARSNVPTIIRVPVIPGFNDSVENIQAIANFACSLENVKEMHLLPYHRLGQNKYKYLNREYKAKDLTPLTDENVGPLKKVVENSGLICKIGGTS